MTIETAEHRTLQTTARPETPERAGLTVRARSTCEGAHVHIGSIRLRHDDVSQFADRYQEQPAASMLARLTASAVNDMQGVLAPRFGLRVYRVEVTATSEGSSLEENASIALDLWIESPETKDAVAQMVAAWEQEFAPAVLPAGCTLQTSLRVVDWYAM
jgi:hypothetical protein